MSDYLMKARFVYVVQSLAYCLAHSRHSEFLSNEFLTNNYTHTHTHITMVKVHSVILFAFTNIQLFFSETNETSL